MGETSTRAIRKDHTRSQDVRFLLTADGELKDEGFTCLSQEVGQTLEELINEHPTLSVVDQTLLQQNVVEVCRRISPELEDVVEKAKKGEINAKRNLRRRIVQLVVGVVIATLGAGGLVKDHVDKANQPPPLTQAEQSMQERQAARELASQTEVGQILLKKIQDPKLVVELLKYVTDTGEVATSIDASADVRAKAELVSGYIKNIRELGAHALTWSQYRADHLDQPLLFTDQEWADYNLLMQMDEITSPLAETIAFYAGLAGETDLPGETTEKITIAIRLMLELHDKVAGQKSGPIDPVEFAAAVEMELTALGNFEAFDVNTKDPSTAVSVLYGLFDIPR